MIEYEDFELRIQADGAGFVVAARRGSQSASEPFALDLPRFCDLWQGGAAVPDAARDVGQTRKSDPVEAQYLGAALFDALIRGRVRDLYQQGRGGAGGDAAKGLRIRIQIDPRDERLRPLLRLPWEILFDRTADAGGLLALDPRRPVVRTIDSMEATRSPTPGPLRRVLLALANPRHSTSLDLESECAKVEAALDRLSIRPEVLRRATRTHLRESICDSDPQIVHFMGHGTYDRKLGEGVLLLEDERGGQDPLPASTLATFFAGGSMPSLVVLASCRSAEPGGDPTSGPFASVAAALVAAGLPAVVAMQTAVRDRSAVRFTERLYWRLVQDDPIEAAVAHARVALQADQTGTLDWAVPVLLVRGLGERAPDGKEETPPPSLERREPLVSQVTSQRDVDFQQIFGYAREVHIHREPGK